jgi:hypothetical protein
MSCNVWGLLTLFTVAIPVGWFLGAQGERLSDPPSSQGASGAVKMESPNRVEVPDYANLLRIQEAAEVKDNAATEPDAFEKLLADWSDAEFAAALNKALAMPECQSPAGANRTLPFRIFGAWMAFRPDAAAAWIGTVRAAEMRDGFVREACRHWPADRALDGIDFLLSHHWKQGASYSEKLMDSALTQAAREGGPNGVIELLEKLAKAKIEMTAEHPNFPRGFDFNSLAASAPYQTHSHELFRESVNAAWFIDQPRSFLDSMRSCGDWERFNIALRAGGREVGGVPAVRLWETADPDSRREMLKAVEWSRLGESLDAETWLTIARERQHSNASADAATWIATLVRDPAMREEWVEGALGNGSFPAPVWIALLETLSEPVRRLEVLRRKYPNVDWRPDGINTPRDPGSAPALREAIRRWGVSVSSLPVTPDTSDPFAP